MGLYTKSTNVNLAGNYDVPVAEGYHGEVGASRILIESIQNDMALFEAVLGNDFQEVALGENATEEQQIALMEAAGVGFIDKIKEFVKKVWEKIKGLFQSFMVHFNNVIISDNKKFVEKYKQNVVGKTYGENFKYTWRKPKKMDEVAKVDDVIKFTETETEKLINYSTLSGKSIEDLEKSQREIADDGVENAYAAIAKQSGKMTTAEFEEWVINDTFEDSEEYEKLDSATIDHMIQILTNSAKIIGNIKKTESNINTFYNKRLGALDKLRQASAKLLPNGKAEVGTGEGDNKVSIENKEDAMKHTKIMGVVYEAVKVEQTVVTKSASLALSMAKFHVKQCRSLFAKAAAYNPKKVNEATFLEAVGQAEEHELETLFEGVYAY